MFIAAIAHKYSFPHEPYHINIADYGDDRSWLSRLAAMWDTSDVQQDITEHFGVVGSSISRRLRGRTSYHLTRGTSEMDHLMTNSTNLASSSCYQGYNYNLSASDSDASTSTYKNHYGSTSSDDRKKSGGNDIVPTHIKNDGINIVKQNPKSKDYSPQYGVPKILGVHFANQPVARNTTQSSTSSSHYDRSSRSDNTASKSESGFDLVAYDKAANETSSENVGKMKKSDSTASDWLSSPTDDFMGLDLKGVDKDQFNFRGNPKI